ncbi:MAG: phenylalanine--tRNA ligase subunit beta [Brevinematales bacterium]|nr:phenylalanine--tRNA ligase subunit beta [Brevinematales bacterium]
MIVTYNWLKEYVDMKISPQELRGRLTQMGPEVVAVTPIGIHEENKDKIFLAKVLKVETHPKLAHLKVVSLDVLKKGVVITTSPHVSEGDFVVWAKPGAILGGATVSEKSFSGISSVGMLLAKEHLGLEAKSSDIWILGKDASQAKDIFMVYTEADYRIEVELTANRSDCLSVIGIAREIAAMLDVPLKMPVIVEGGKKIAEMPDITIEERKLCPRYSGRIIRGVKVGPSPAWIARRLEVCGIRSINNVVDATNYVLLEYGHPTHAFDLDLLEGKKIVVRRAEDGETLTTLDGETHTLNEDVLVISDGKRAVALAGIMGGENTEIRETTKNVLLESAFFDPISIRQTAKRYGIRTESSYRFERTADYGITVTVIQRLTHLLSLSLPDIQVSEIRDEYPQPFKEKVVSLSTEFVNNYLGIELETDEMEKYLERLGFTIMKSLDDGCEVRVPSFRSDISRPVDLVEEIARVYGYNNIVPKLFKPPVDVEAMQKPGRFEYILRPTMRSLGYSEVYNFTFTSEELLERFGWANDDFVKLRNPLSSDAAILRPSLIPQMVETLDRNIRRTYRESFLLYEIGKTFTKKGNTPEMWEKNCLAFLRYGVGGDVYDITAEVERLVRMQGESMVDVLSAKLPFLHPRNSALFEVEGKILGFAGELHPAVGEVFEFRYPVYVAEVDINVLEGLKKPLTRLEEIPTMPPIPRDISVVVDKEVPGRKLMNAIKMAHPLIKQVAFADVYVGPQLPSGKKSLTFSFVVQAKDKTLTDEEANAIRDEVVELLRKTFGAELR